MDWFLYGYGFRHERVERSFRKLDWIKGIEIQTKLVQNYVNINLKLWRKMISSSLKDLGKSEPCTDHCPKGLIKA